MSVPSFSFQAKQVAYRRSFNRPFIFARDFDSLIAEELDVDMSGFPDNFTSDITAPEVAKWVHTLKSGKIDFTIEDYDLGTGDEPVSVTFDTEAETATISFTPDPIYGPVISGALSVADNGPSLGGDNERRITLTGTVIDSYYNEDIDDTVNRSLSLFATLRFGVVISENGNATLFAVISVGMSFSENYLNRLTNAGALVQSVEDEILDEYAVDIDAWSDGLYTVSQPLSPYLVDILRSTVTIPVFSQTWVSGLFTGVDSVSKFSSFVTWFTPNIQLFGVTPTVALGPVVKDMVFSELEFYDPATDFDPP